MATDETSAASSPTRPHDHSLPHSHAHHHRRPHLHLATTSDATIPSFTPGFSILRTSLSLRLGFALFAAVLIWTAFHWATR